MTPNEYRAKKKRCRTCLYANGRAGWFECEAKNTYHRGYLFKSKLRGMFCQLYNPKWIWEVKK